MSISPRIFRESPGSVWEVVLIAAGWSKNNRYYSAETLRKAIPLFENAPISLYGYDPGQERNHVPTQWRDSSQGLVANIAGWVTGVHEAVVDGRMALVGNFDTAGSSVKELLAKMPNSNALGLSIDAVGQSLIGEAEGRRGYLVTSVDYVYELTIVDRPAAGGKFLRMIASMGSAKKANFWEWLCEPVPGRRQERGLSFVESIRQMQKRTKLNIGGRV